MKSISKGFQTMRELFWKMIAGALAATPMIRNLLVRLAKRTPYTPILGSDGSLYMERFWLIKERSWLPFAMRIHVIHRPDADRHPHDHPWDFRTLILDGFYEEELLDIKKRPMGWKQRARAAAAVVMTSVLRAGDTATRNRGQYHRITRVPSPVTTLVICSRRHSSWGFLVGGRHVPWRDYDSYLKFLKERS